MNKTPHQIAEEILIMADNCGTLAERLNELTKLYALWWETMRLEFTSDKQAEKAWDLTKDGQEMLEIKLKIKTKERKISAYKVYLRVLETEARNQF